MPNIDRTKLRELDKAATPGPWIVGDGAPDSNYFYDVICQEGDRERVLLQFNQNFPDKIPTDRKLIVEARNSIIPLLDALEAAEQQQKCPACHGDGEAPDVYGTIKPCPHCDKGRLLAAKDRIHLLTFVNESLKADKEAAEQRVAELEAMMEPPSEEEQAEAFERAAAEEEDAMRDATYEAYLQGYQEAEREFGTSPFEGT